MKTQTTPITEDPTTPGLGKDLALWTSVLGAPAIWAVQLEAGYALGPLSCKFGIAWPLYLLGILCIVGAAITVFPSYSQWRGVDGGSPDATDGGTIARRRFLGGLGIIVSLTFLTVIIAQALSAVFFNPCWS